MADYGLPKLHVRVKKIEDLSEASPPDLSDMQVSFRSFHAQ
jgi:hypothetical protein